MPAGVDVSDGLDTKECELACGPGAGGSRYWSCQVMDAPAYNPNSFACYTCVEGRRPEGYVDASHASHASLESTVAGWLAHAADLERVSVDAFQILARELLHHGADRALLDRVAEAEADEVRHARVVGALARREGAVLRDTPVVHGPVRPLIAIALENAVEGCIRETYGAIVASWQAEHAERLDIRRAMKRIAVDETAHAQLAWDVHAWLLERLTAEERDAVARAMDAASAELALSARATLAPDLVADLGLPDAATARRLVMGLDVYVWTPARAA